MDLFSLFATNLGIGLQEAFTVTNLWYCFVGVFLGTLVGVLPGLGSLIAISLLLPITYHLPATGALIICAFTWLFALTSSCSAASCRRCASSRCSRTPR